MSVFGSRDSRMCPSCDVDAIRIESRGRQSFIVASARDGRRAGMRENEVLNAVAFLSHESVKNSSDASAKRGFLEGKGLTREEIDEAFRRAGGGGGGGETWNASGSAVATTSSSSSGVGVVGAVARLAATVGAAYLAYPSARRWLELAAKRARERDAKSASATEKDADASVVTPSTPVMQTPTMSTPGTTPMVMGVSPEMATKIENAVERAAEAESRTEALREEIKSEMTTTLKESMSDMRKLLETQLREELAEMKRALARERSTPSQTSSVIQREWPLRASPPGSESGESPGSLVFTPDQNAARSEGEFTLNNASNQDVSSSGEVNFFSARQPQTRPSRPFADAKTNDLTDPPHPGKFMDILQMIESGTTPPGIKDIDDAPPNPDITIPRSSSSRPGKPYPKAPQTADEDEVPIKRINLDDTSESPWKPPPAPELSRVMSSQTSQTVSSTTGGGPTSPRSPRRSVDHRDDKTEAASIDAKLQI